MYLAIWHFKHFVEGFEFHIRTDHKPLIYALGARPDRHSPRRIHHLDFIAQFTSDIRFVGGSDNAAADALSRIAVNATHSQHPTIDFQSIAQQSDAELHQLQDSDTSLDLCTILLPSSPTPLTCPLATLDHGFLSVYAVPFSTHSTNSLTLASEPPRNSSQLVLCGLVSTGMSASGPEVVLSASDPYYCTSHPFSNTV